VVIGGGFGGLQVVKELRRASVAVTLVDERNFHLFAPLTYQVATGALSPSDVTYPLRAVFADDDHVRVLLARVRGFDLAGQRVLLEHDAMPAAPDAIEYDTLVVAAGSSYSYFGHEEWREFALEVKTLESAIAVRSRVLEAFERAELCDDEAERAAEMTFVVVGGGPTGVEISGQIAELCRQTLDGTFDRIDPARARILLLEAGDRILTSFSERLAQRGRKALERLGVQVAAQREVVGIDADGVSLKAPDSEPQRLSARTVIWAAGVRASELAGALGEQSGAEVDRSGRVMVSPELTLPGHPEVFAIGDMAVVADGAGGVRRLPGLAPVAIQQGAYVARTIRHRLAAKKVHPFHYVNKGNLATIGRGWAVAELGIIRLSGLPAWLIWLGVHIWYLVGYQNRLVVMLRWSISFITSGRSLGSRIISRPSRGAG
jgi:NADH dehydrogenase